MRLETFDYVLACALIPSPGSTDQEEPDHDIFPSHSSFSAASPPVRLHVADAGTGGVAKINQGINKYTSRSLNN